jgi:hypothetical protein
MSHTDHQAGGIDAKWDPVPAAVQAVIALFQEELGSVRFPGVDQDSLAERGNAVREQAQQVEALRRQLEVAEADLGGRQRELRALAEQGLAYARLYAVQNPSVADAVERLTLVGRGVVGRGVDGRGVDGRGGPKGLTSGRMSSTKGNRNRTTAGLSSGTSSDEIFASSNETLEVEGPPEGARAEATSSEATSSEATFSEATSSEATSSEATFSEATFSEATSSEATSSAASSSHASAELPVPTAGPNKTAGEATHGGAAGAATHRRGSKHTQGSAPMVLPAMGQLSAG